MTSLLLDFPITHAGLKPYQHPRLGVIVNGQTAVRYLRFGQRVRLDRLELPRAVYGRATPAVPTHPTHLIISVFDSRTRQWETVREVDFPRNPGTEGRGLSQHLTAEQMEAHFAKVLTQKPHVIRLNGLVTDHLRVECDHEHPVWPNHGECNGGEFNVPFGILNPLRAFGKPVSKPPPATYLPGLRQTQFRPRPPRGMKVRELPQMLMFEGRKLAVGFSLRRPMLLHLGWDTRGAGGAARNRLLATQAFVGIGLGGLSGPVLRTFTHDCQPHHWTGQVSVVGNKVTYRNLHCAVPGVRLDAAFMVEPDRLIISLTQGAEQEIPAIENAAWRLVWDCGAAMTGAAALPTLRPGRNGDVQLPMLWAGDGVGCLSCRLLDGDAHLQVESYRPQRVVTGSFALSRREATVELAVTNLEPPRRASRGVMSNWSAVYSCFRPELGGFSNNAVSVNCHVNQHAPAEIVAFTRPRRHGPKPVDLYRFTIERALLDGGGYSYWRDLYLDSDPVLLCGAGRIHQTEPNLAWLLRIEPGLIESVRRILGTIGGEGLVVCRALSGNSGSFRWSSNAMDVVGFGHMDAYVNAWTYRALRNAAALLRELGRKPEMQRCRDAAVRLRTAFPKYLLNPKTGWVAGWRSRDGRLHDYAFLFVNGPACAFGLLDRPVARRALQKLELLREKVGASSTVGGLPCSLLPIAPADHMLPKVIRNFPSKPTFETYTDGSMGACFAGYYLRALSIYGLKAQAKRMAGELDQGYAAGLWTGGVGSGVEFRRWDGVPCGYEGTFVMNFSALYGIAVEQGVIRPTDPEWWPA